MPQRNLVEFICEIVVFFVPNVLLKALEAEHPIIDSNFQTNTRSSSLQVLHYQKGERGVPGVWKRRKSSSCQCQKSLIGYGHMVT
ncbi:hypothetical protein ACFX13_005871 [Malus domestica]